MVKKKFLITTSIKETFPKYKKKESILLAGEWCKADINKKYLKKYKFETLPYHWDSETKKAKDSIYLKKIYYKLERDLSIYFNKVHRTKFPQRYWSIIISPWLSSFIIYFYDKYSIIKKIKNKYKTVNAKTSDSNNLGKLIPQNWLDAQFKFQSHQFNHYIFSFLIKKLSINENKNIGIKINIRSNQPFQKNIKNVPKYSLKKLFRFILDCFKSKNDSFLINSNLSSINEMLVNFLLNYNFKKNQSYEFNKQLKVDKNLRNSRLVSSKRDDEFIKLTKDILPKIIPTYYLEGYKIINNFCSNLPWSSNPKLIFTSRNHITDEVFNYWSASHSLKKVPIVYGQHGGSFFISKYTLEREIEINRADKFLAWGKVSTKGEKILNFYNDKSSLKTQSYDPHGKINIIQGTPRKYQTTCISGQLSLSQFKKNIIFQKHFISRLKKIYLKNTQIRLYYPHAGIVFSKYQNFEKKLWLEKRVAVKIERSNVPIEKSINESRLLIHTALESTLFLEALNLNIPSILFVDFNNKFISKKDINLFKSLKNQGLIYDNPNDLAEFINLNYKNIDNWWKSNNTQKTLRRFCDLYSSRNSKPIKTFKETLKKIVQ